MALRFIDSFAHYGTTPTAIGLLARKWTQVFGSINFNSDPTQTGTGFGLNLVSGFLNTGRLFKTLTHKATWYAGVRIYPQQFDGTYHGLHNNQSLASWQINADGTMSLFAGANAIGTSSSSLHLGRKYYVEIGYTLSGTTNISVNATLRVNGIVWVTGTALSGINQSSLLLGTATVNVHQFQGPNSNAFMTVSDLYIFDGDGSLNNTFAGDVNIIAIFPNGDVVTQWTPSTGTVHYVLINNPTPDDDATYVSETVATHQDIYDWQDIPTFQGTIRGVQLSFMSRKTAEGTKTFKQVVGDTGTEQSSDTFSVSDDYIYFHFPYDVDPATGLAWTRAGFNAKRFGVNLVS